MDTQASPVLIKTPSMFKTITPEPSNINNTIIKPTPINKSQSISPEPLFKRMRLF
jgi:hypothetical protein